MGGGYDFEFGCGCDYDDKSVFPPDRHLVEVGVLEKIVHPPSFRGTISDNGEVISNA